jgi:hypothetical protein
MKIAGRKPGAPEWLIVAGSCMFIFVLWLSAYFQADIRWLHFFQAWMYVAAMWLSLAGSRWGYFIGISAAALWDYSSVFVNNFFRSGLHWLAASISSGQLKHVDQIVAVPAWIGNLLVVIGSVWAYARLKDKQGMDLGRGLVTFAATTGFFALAMALFQPRYLSLFRGILHPHRPW